MRIKVMMMNFIGWLGYDIYQRKNPYVVRESTLFAKDYFKGKNIIAAEVGIMKGLNAKNIISELSLDKFYAIDAYDLITEKPHIKKAEKKANDYFSTVIKPKVIIIKKTSDEAVDYIPMCDYIYIDGEHNYEQVKKDMKMYYHKVKRGGILAGHDADYGQVSKAFCEFIHEKGLKPYIEGRDWWVIKE